ncbi:MAG: hypothetical protein ACOCU6_01685 [Nanoarchaeota archaeon]
MKKKIKNIEKKQGRIIVRESDIVKTYLVDHKLENTLDPALKESGKVYVVTTNTLDNIRSLINRWEDVKNQNNLVIIFTNVEENCSWHLNPRIHGFITDENKLKDSLITLHESIPESKG